MTGVTTSVTLNTIAPITYGSSTTGMAGPPDLPFTAAVITPQGNRPCGYVT